MIMPRKGLDAFSGLTKIASLEIGRIHILIVYLSAEYAKSAFDARQKNLPNCCLKSTIVTFMTKNINLRNFLRGQNNRHVARRVCERLRNRQPNSVMIAVGVELFRKVQDVADCRGSERIDRPRIVADNRKAATLREADLTQLAQIASTYPSRERFLTELTLDPSDATSDETGAPLLDEDYMILSDPFGEGAGSGRPCSCSTQ
jgi:hypothetical protein